MEIAKYLSKIQIAYNSIQTPPVNLALIGTLSIQMENAAVSTLYVDNMQHSLERAQAVIQVMELHQMGSASLVSPKILTANQCKGQHVDNVFLDFTLGLTKNVDKPVPFVKHLML